MVTPSSLDQGVLVESGDAHTIDEWRRLVGNRFVPVRLTSAQSDGRFHGSLRARRVDGNAISDIAADAHLVQRSASLISSDDPKQLKLTMQLKGTAVVVQDGRSCLLREGDTAIYDTARPYTLEYSGDMRSLVMMFPHDMLSLSSLSIARMTAVRLPGDSGVGVVIRPFLEHLAEGLEQLSGVNGMRIIRSAFGLLTAMLSAELDQHQDPGCDRFSAAAIRMFIDSHLGDPKLTAERIARAHHTSLRQLQYLFHDEGLTVSGYIREQRLARCRIDLRDPSMHALTIADIAQHWGFLDPSHFSKLFRSRFGCTPRDFRMGAVALD